MSINGLFCDDSDRKFTKTWGILRGGAEQKKPEEGFIWCKPRDFSVLEKQPKSFSEYWTLLQSQ